MDKSVVCVCVCIIAINRKTWDERRRRRSAKAGFFLYLNCTVNECVSERFERRLMKKFVFPPPLVIYGQCAVLRQRSGVSD